MLFVRKLKDLESESHFFLLASLLLSLTCSCGTMKSLVEVDNVLGDALLPSNIEKPGTDCVVICDIKISHKKTKQSFHSFVFVVPK